MDLAAGVLRNPHRVLAGIGVVSHVARERDGESDELVWVPPRRERRGDRLVEDVRVPTAGTVGRRGVEMAPKLAGVHDELSYVSVERSDAQAVGQPDARPADGRMCFSLLIGD